MRADGITHYTTVAHVGGDPTYCSVARATVPSNDRLIEDNGYNSCPLQADIDMFDK